MYSDTLEFFPPFIAHRGAQRLAPENSLEAFAAARDAGVKWIETDVKLTSDGVPVLIHDETLDRTTSGRGPVADMTWNEMRRLDAGSWFSPSFAGTRIASLSELVIFCAASKMRLVLELKPSPGRTQATVMVSLIEAAKLWPEGEPPPLVSSFSKDALMIAAQLHPDWPRGLLLEEWTDDWLESVVMTQASMLTIKDDLLTPQRLDILHDAPVPVLSYTVNDAARAKMLLSNGIKAVYADDLLSVMKPSGD